MATRISLKIQAIQAELMTNFDLIKRKEWQRGKNVRTPRKKYPEPVTYHKHPNSNSNALGKNENMFQQTRNTFEKIGASYSNIVKQKPKNYCYLYR